MSIKTSLHTLIKYGALAGLMVAAMPDFAWAVSTTDLKGSLENVTGEMEKMPVVLSAAAYLIGGMTILHGAGLLKKHADQPSGTPLAAGLTRVFGGGFIASLPYGIAWAVHSLAIGGTSDHPYIPVNPAQFPALPGVSTP